MKLRLTAWAFCLILIAGLFSSISPRGNALPFGHGGGSTSSPPPADIQSALLATMTNDTWAAASSAPGIGPNTTLNSVVWNCSSSCSPAATAANIAGFTGPSSIMSTWSGAAFDPDDDWIIFYGGGHHDYWGNEVYSYNLKTLQFVRLTAPDPVDGNNCPVDFSTQPAANHSYDEIVYNTTTHHFQMVGTWGAAGTGSCVVTNMLTMAPASQNPANLGSWQFQDTLSFTFGGTAAYDSTANRTYAMTCTGCNGGGQAGLNVFNEGASPGSQWTVRGSGITRQNDTTAAIDKVHGWYVVIGSGHLTITRISDGAQVDFTTVSGNTSCLNGNGPGHLWDPDDNKLLCWNGGATIYVEDLSAVNDTCITNNNCSTPPTVTAHTNGIGGATPQCSTPADCTSSTGTQNNGTYGRFIYDTVHHSLAVVNTITDQVYIYKRSSF